MDQMWASDMPTLLTQIAAPDQAEQHLVSIAVEGVLGKGLGSEEGIHIRILTLTLSQIPTLP